MKIQKDVVDPLVVLGVLYFFEATKTLIIRSKILVSSIFRLYIHQL